MKGSTQQLRVVPATSEGHEIKLKSLTSWKKTRSSKSTGQECGDALDEAEENEAAEEEEDDESEEEDEVVRAAEAIRIRLLHPIGEQA